MVLDRGAWVAMALSAGVTLAGVASGCDGSPLATPHPVDTRQEAAPRATTIPADVGPPVMKCDDGTSYALDLPCNLGMGLAFETDCLYGTDTPQTLRFVLPESLPDAGGSFASIPPLGLPQRFHASLIPPLPAISSGGPAYTLQSIAGTVTFVTGSLIDRSLDGWFTHLDFVFQSGDQALSCALDNGRFTTVPANYE